MNTEKIRTKENTYCPVCKEKGIPLYNDLKDRIFKTPGLWNIKKCPKNNCGTLWLDPTPVEADIIKLYDDYHTHVTLPFVPHKSVTQPIFDRIRASYLAHKYGYKPLSPSVINKLWRFVAYLHPGWIDIQAANIYYLPAKHEGLLLDVGSGNGDTLRSMKNMGWDGVGIDFDEGAVKNARSNGLDVRLGELSAQKFEDNSFDAIIINHVIEHANNPLGLLKESYRILKKNGVMVVTTPNVKSIGHAIYGKNWRGLETPQHLHLFTNKSLHKIADDAGYTNIKTFTSLQGSSHMLDESAKLAKNEEADRPPKNNLLNRTIKHIRWFIVGWIHLLIPGRDEMLVLICKK